MDLVIALDSANVISAFDALATLGYKPRVPITAEQFANAEIDYDETNSQPAA